MQFRKALLSESLCYFHAESFSSHIYMKLTKMDLHSILGTGAVLGIALFLFLGLKPEEAKAWDIAWGYYLSLLTLLIGFGVFLWRIKEYKQRILSHLPSRSAGIVALLVLVIAGAFVSTQIHRQHRVLSDENSWESMAMQMHFAQSGGVCNQGYWVQGELQCTDEVNNFKGKTMGLFESMQFKVMEVGRDTALALNFPLYLASLLFFGFALFRFSGNQWASIAAMVFLAAMPIYMMQAQAASTEVLYVFLLSVLLVFYSIVSPAEVGWRHVILYVAVLGLFSGTRQETLFCFIPFALYYHEFLRRKSWHLPLFTTLVILASLPAVNTMAAYRGYDFQGGTHEAHSFENFWYNMKSNISIMLSSEMELGMLKNPFFQLFTVLLLASTAWLIIRLFVEKKYRYPALLLGLFHLQSFVILYNVSGTFEIDINQRYVLVALPTFAFLMAFGLWDFLSVVPSLQSPLRKNAAVITALVAILLSGYLIWDYRDSFRGNMLYHRNKLLSEEDFLNTELQKYPERSIFLYARPWQMLCSGFNSFSEQTFLGWSEQEYAKWKEWSGDNIYLVRGQDGYGSVDKSSRVVGFKTTDPIERILQEYATDLKLVNSKDFGYPLTVTKILRKQGRSAYAEALVVEMPVTEIDGQDSLPIRIRKSFGDSLSLQMSLDGTILLKDTLLESVTSLTRQQLPYGMHRIDFLFVAPGNDTIRRSQDFFVRGETARLLNALPLIRHVQEWAEPKWGQTVEGRTLQVNKRQFTYGYGAHANSALFLKADGRYQKLHTWVGLDDESACGDGAQWLVLGDGKELWRSSLLTALMIDSATIQIAGIRELELRIDRITNNLCDHGNWLGSWVE